MGRHEDSPDKGSDGEDGIVSRITGNDHSQVRWETTTCSTIPTKKTKKKRKNGQFQKKKGVISEKARIFATYACF